MDSSQLLSNKQPISLKWKWGVLLFVIMLLMSTTTLISTRILTERHHAEEKTLLLSDQVRRLEDYLQASPIPFQPVDSIKDDTLAEMRWLTAQQNIFKNLPYIEGSAFYVQILSQDNKVVYQTNGYLHEEFEPSQEEPDAQYNQMPTIATTKALQSVTTGQGIGFMHVIMKPEFYQLGEQQVNSSLNWLLITLFVLSLLTAAGLSMYFLRPLNYLNNALDRVEEDNISDIRMRKPRHQDEWSDLSIHVNKLLDKIDQYVSNQKQFVEDVSHELRTPVAIVEGHLKLLQRWGKDDPEVLANSIDASLQEMTRMKDLVQEMLDLSRADHVDVDYRDEVTEIYSTTQQIFNNFKMLYEHFYFNLDIDHSKGDTVYVRMYRNHFEQIMIILLDNAVKYSNDRQEIHISVSRTMNQVEIAVQDFGEGMSDEDKQKVFDRFYRIDKARSREKGGNGLGLSIAKQLVESYRGEIRVDSSLNEGSIFYISLPYVTDPDKLTELLSKTEEKNNKRF